MGGTPCQLHASSLSFQNSAAQELASAARALFCGGMGSALVPQHQLHCVRADTGGLAPLADMEQEQSDDQTQLSTLGTLVSQLQALQSAATTLSTGGVVDIQPSSTYSDFTTSGSATTEGNYTIQVNQLATTAQMRSQPLRRPMTHRSYLRARSSSPSMARQRQA